MPFCRRFQLLLGALLVACCAGCSIFGDRTAKTADSPVAERESDWWKSNKHRAEFVPGRGYALPGVPGFFDQSGRPMQGDAQQASYEPPVVPKSNGTKWLDQLNPLSPLIAIEKSFHTPPNEQLARQRYEEGEVLFRKKSYKESAAKYHEAAQLAPDSGVEEDAMFMEAESLFFADKYPYANDAYNALVKQYSSTRHLDKVSTRQFAIAQYWQKHHEKHPHWPTTPNLLDRTRHKFDTAGHALKAYENIRLNDPTGPLADDALMATASFHFTMGHYDDADYHYGLVRTEYPDSEHQFQAHLLGLQCKLRKYQGPDYDVTPLVEADKLAEQLLTQFPNQIDPERERVEQTRRGIAAARAMQDWTVAEYFVGRGYYGAARFYYEQIVHDYPSTNLAEESRKRLGEIASEPDVPAQKLDWLVKVFPDGKKGPVIAAQPSADTVRK